MDGFAKCSIATERQPGNFSHQKNLENRERANKLERTIRISPPMEQIINKKIITRSEMITIFLTPKHRKEAMRKI